MTIFVPKPEIPFLMSCSRNFVILMHCFVKNVSVFCDRTAEENKSQLIINNALLNLLTLPGTRF